MKGLLMHGSAVVAIAAAWSAAVGTASGQEGGELNVDVGDCIRLEAPQERLACYESRVEAALGKDTTPREQAPQPGPRDGSPAAEASPLAGRDAAPAETASQAKPRERRGATNERRASRAERAAAEEIVSRVQTLRETVPNAYVITLENGQVWRQTQPKWYPLRPGQEVRIFGTRWGGASRLTADEINSYIQVELVQ